MESDLSYWIVLIVCIILSAIFSATETALTTLPETYVQQIIDSKPGKFNPFRLWFTRPNRVLTAIIVGNNLVNTLAAVVATIYAQKLFDNYVISIATTLVTLALLIFGEITPKTFARHNAKSIVSWLIYIIYPIYFLLFPAVWVLSHFAVFLVHMMGGQTKRSGPVATEEDIAYLIKLSHREGVFSDEQGDMLHSVISFRDTCAREIMVPRTALCSFNINASTKEIREQVAQHGFTRWPVYGEDIDDVVGILYVKDMLGFHSHTDGEFVLKNHLREAFFIPDSMKLDAVLKEFQRKKVHMAIVVDEYGGTAGIVTLEDILEEIVGEIQDEYDKEEEEAYIEKIADDHFIVDGRCSIDELKRVCHIDLPSEEPYETVGGFVVTTFGRFPAKGEAISYEGCQFKVIEAEEKRIGKVEIKMPVKPDSDVED